MDLYSLEFFIEKLDIFPNTKVKHKDLQVQVKCSDFLDTQIKYFIKLSAYNLKKTGVGKAVVFSCNRSKLIAGFTSDFRVVISDTDEFETTLGTAVIQWLDNFEVHLKALDDKSASHIQHSGKYNIKSAEGKVIGSMQAQMCLVSYGGTIEVPIAYLGSQISIPLSFRTHKSQHGNEEWTPMFLAPKKPVKSLMDPGMEFYAEMAGITPQPQMTALLTPDYINSHLCNNKACPGAQRFKDYGLGPLATDGSGLGTVVSIKETKPCGLYGMSQAYGTMDNYGAYGLFVQKPKKPKSCCGSPDCPYTIYFGKPDDIPDDLLNDRPKKCHCKNCRKNNGNSNSPSKRSTSSSPKRDNCNLRAVPKVSSACGGPKCPYAVPKADSNCGSINCLYGASNIEKQTGCGNPNCGVAKVDSTCGTPNCPKLSPKSGVTCPFLNKPPRQSAGADKYNEECQKPTCPHSKNQQNKTSAGADRYREDCQLHSCPHSTNQQNKTYAGADRYKEECQLQSCPHSTNQQNKRYSTSVGGTCGGIVCPLEDPLTVMENFLSSIPPKASTEKRNCNDKSCLYYEESKNCKDKTCLYYNEPDNHEVPDEEEIGPCGGRICPLDKQEKSFSPEEIFGAYSGNSLVGFPKRASIEHGEGETKQKRLSVLINEDGNTIMLNANGDNVSLDPNNLTLKSKELLSTLSMADNSDIFLLISRLLAERNRSYSLNNYFSLDETKSYSDDANFKNANLNSIDKEKKKEKPKGPCSKDTCKFQKYKTCSECGGVSRSGATCDNTNVSFSTISYDSIVTTAQDTTAQDTITQNTEPKEKPKTPIKSATDKKKTSALPDGTTPSQHDKMTVKIAKPHRRKSRFVYHGGEMYPGIRLGHKTCVIGSKNVPAHMGWLWNIRNPGDPKRKKGWKPGVMYKCVEQRIIENRRAKGIPDPPELKMLVKKVKNAGYQQESESEEEEIEPKPTLTIEKKEGNYLITMNPLKDPKTLAPNENPYMRCKPMQFLIVKPKKEAKAGPLIIGSEDECEDEEDFYNSYRNTCRCDEDSRMLESSSSSDSELNIEFTTPAGIINPEEMKKPPNVINTCTQFKVTDFDCDDCTIIIPKKFKKEKKRSKRI